MSHYNSPNGLSQGANANRQGGSNNNRLDNNNSNNNSNNSQSQDKNNNNWVINLPSISLTEAKKSVLAKGPNYSITAKYIPNVKYIRGRVYVFQTKRRGGQGA